VGILVTARVQRISLRDPLLLVVAGLWLSILAALGIVVWLAPTELANTLSSLLGNGILLLVLSAFFIAAWRGGVDSYDTFVEGAKEGFALAVRLIPYLVAMLAAIAMLRAGGVLDLFLDGIRFGAATIGWDTRFVDALPVAFLKPLSGSGARAPRVWIPWRRGWLRSCRGPPKLLSMSWLCILAAWAFAISDTLCGAAWRRMQRG
jgi:hypothetical protein